MTNVDYFIHKDLKIQESEVTCFKCAEPCCMAVKHMPYHGETSEILLEHMLVGSFPAVYEKIYLTNTETERNTFRHEVQPSQRLFVTEWVVPGESSSCPAFKDGKCIIYHHRPDACRMFPLISHDKKVHPFCRYGEYFRENDYDSVYKKSLDFHNRLDRFDLALNREEGNTIPEYSGWLDETPDMPSPVLYNSHFAAVLLIAGSADPLSSIRRQQLALQNFIKGGVAEITMLLPGTDYCMTFPIEELMLNIDMLIYRIEKQDLLNHLQRCVLSAME